MKRTISSIDVDSAELLNKRAKLEPVEYTNPLDLPEIFAHILSYLIYKPKHVVKLAQLSTKCNANMHNAQVWIYLGYRNVISNNGQIDPHVLAVFLRQIDKDRLAKKYVEIQCTWKRYDERWKSRSRELTKDLGEEAKKWLAISDVIDKKYGLRNSLSESFYEQVLANQILSDSVIKAIATMKSNLVPYSDLFRAFRYVLYFPRADLEREAQRNKNIPKVAALSSLRIEPICPLLTKLNPPTYLTGLPALFFKDTFIVCHSINSQTHTLSCFFRFCSDGTKAVIFTTRGDSNWGGSVDYCKVNLSTKSVESSGCLYRLAKLHGQDMEYSIEFSDIIYRLPVKHLKGKYKYSQVTQALVSLFEISIGDEEMKQIDTTSWLRECGVRSKVIKRFDFDNQNKPRYF